MPSLERRLQVGLAMSLILLIGGAWWLGQRALHRAAEGFVEQRLLHDAEALAGALHRGRDGRLAPGQRRLTPVYHQPFSGHYFVVQAAGGPRIRSRSLWDRDLGARTLAPGETARWLEDGPRGQRLLVVGQGYRFDGEDLSLLVAEDVAPLARRLASFDPWFALLAGGALLGMLLLQHALVRHALGLLAPVYRDMARLERGEVASLTEQVPREVQGLVVEFNRLLALFGQRLARSRHLAGNLGHALKAPLAVLRQQLDDPTLALDADRRAALLAQTDRLTAVIERQLQRARLAGRGGVGLRFDPAAELPVLVEVLRRLHAARGLAIDAAVQADAPASLVDADREDMLELLGNLLDNACKWARSRVRCRVVVGSGGALRLRVEDDGPGCPPESLDAITGRGVRLDESVDGHGLGLAIVAEIVASYQGALRFGRSEALGGLCAEVQLPGHGGHAQAGRR